MHIGIDEAIDNLLAEAVAVVKGKMLHAHFAANAFGILNVVQATAFAVHNGQANILVIKKLHADLSITQGAVYGNIYANPLLIAGIYSVSLNY